MGAVAVVLVSGPGEYAEGDVFIGAAVPQVRRRVREFADLPHSEGKKLLRSKVHEERLLALLILVRQYERGDESARPRVFRLYTTHLKWIKNWDLIDVTAPHIIGSHLSKCEPRAVRYDWAVSDDLWHRRLAIMSTFHFTPHDDSSDTLRRAEILLHDPHNLIHKAVGWMLREIGNHDRVVEERFLKKHYRKMPRTMLRYAIKKFPESRRQAYLTGKV